MSNSMVTTGVVAFSNLTKTDVYNGQDTGKYNLVLVMDPEQASKLEDAGVKLREYEGKPQRKFASKFPVTVVDVNDEPYPSREIPYGSTVRVLWTLGPVHPQHGASTYLNRVRVVEEAEHDVDAVPEEF